MKKFILSLVFLFAVILSQAQIQADFTWSDPQCSGGTIVFSDASVGGNTISWLWEVDGNIEHQGSPTFYHSFPQVTTDTTFNVMLVVIDGNGYGSDITKTITIYPLPTVTVSPTDPTICQGNSVTLSASGSYPSYAWSNAETNSIISVSPDLNTEYTVAVTDTNQCQNTTSTTVFVWERDTTIVEDYFCEGETYDFFGENLTSADTYYHTLTSINGCDSIIQLELIQNPIYNFPETAEICDGESYSWHGTEYSTEGVYSANYPTVNGCDSIYELTLTVHPFYNFSETAEICDGESYSWHGTEYSTEGVYNANYPTVNGCDSIYELDLTVNPIYEFITNESVCEGDSIQWRGQWYSENDTYTEDLTSYTGCDSTYVLNLTVNPLPELVSILKNPTTGFLPTGTMGSVSLSTSYEATTYWTTKGAAMFSGNISGTGSLLSLGSSYVLGSYDVWSKTDLGCMRKQGIVVFTEDNGTGKIIATPTYGNTQSSFADASVKMRVYQLTEDINNNPVIIPLGNAKFTTNGNAEFDGLDGNYYLKSELVAIPAYPTVVPIFFYDGPTVDSADIVSVPLGTIMAVTINHPEYPDTTGSNTIGGSIDSLGGAKSTGGIPDQIVILRNVITGQILSVAITDENGEYFMPKAPNYSNLELFVTSFQYQNWTAADLHTASTTHYTVNFIVNGNDVYPASSGIDNVGLVRLDFTIYPNPTSDLIHLENVPDGSLLQIFDLQGRLLVSDYRSQKKVLDVSSLPAGQYIIVISHDSSVGTHKMIKN